MKNLLKFSIIILVLLMAPVLSASAQTETEKEIGYIMEKIEPGMSDLEKLIVVHNHFTMNYHYDERYQNYTAESLFENKSAVCQGFAEAYKYVLDLLGFENDYVDIPGHRWNMVKLDGEWYHIDVTWDNPISSVDDFSFANFYFFLVNDEQLSSEEFYKKNGIVEIQGHDRWYSKHKSTSTKYVDAPWRKAYVSKPINYVDGFWYYGNSVQGIEKYDPDTGKSKIVLSMEEFSEQFYDQTYGFLGGPVYKYGKYLYFRTSKAIFRYNVTSGDVALVKSYVGTKYYLQSMKINGNILTYYMQAGGISAPIETGTIKLDTLETEKDVKFIVSPENAAVKFNGVTKRAKEGKVVFENVPLGEQTYTVSAAGYETKTDTAIVSHTKYNFNISLKKNVDVTFNCNVDGAVVTLGGSRRTIREGTTTYTNIAEGTYEYSVTASGRQKKTGKIKVSDGMGPVEITLLKTNFIESIEGLRTKSVSFDEDKRKITVVADYTQSSAGFALDCDVDSLKAFTVETNKSISLGEKDGKRFFVAKKSVGHKQSFEIYIKSTEGLTYTYQVDFTFYKNPDDIKIHDILGLRVYSAEVSDAKIQFNIDNVLTSAGFQLVFLDEDVAVAYEWISSTEGLYKISDGHTDTYNSLLYNTIGSYGRKTLRVFPKSNGVRQKLIAKLYYKNNPDDFKTVTIVLAFMDLSYEGDVRPSEIVGLRTDSAKIDVVNKKITLKAAEGVTSAGFTVKVNGKPPTKFTCQSGKKLAYGQIDNYRYIVAKKSVGKKQNYFVKIYNGYEYSVYDVIIEFP